jgi:hypothetical protein
LDPDRQIVRVVVRLIVLPCRRRFVAVALLFAIEEQLTYWRESYFTVRLTQRNLLPRYWLADTNQRIMEDFVVFVFQRLGSRPLTFPQLSSRGDLAQVGRSFLPAQATSDSSAAVGTRDPLEARG